MRGTFALAACFVALVAAVPEGARGQQRCELSQTLQECWDLYNDPSEPEAEQARNEEAENLVAAATQKTGEDARAAATGAETGGSNFASTTKDFLPLFTLAGLLSESEDEGGEGTAVFDLNLPFLNAEQRRNLKIRLRVDTEVELSEAVMMALPEETRSELAETLLEDLADTDEYSLSLTYNADNRSHGRSFGLHRSEFAALARRARRQVSTAAADSHNKEFQELVQRHPEQATKPIGQWQGITDAEKILLLLRTEAAAKAAADLDAAMSTALQASHLDRFADLLANQPQFHVTAAWKPRETLSGGDELSGKATYEWSKVNLNGALDDPSCSDTSDEANAAACLETYIAYVDANGEAIDNSLRFTASFEYSDIDEQRVDLSAVDLDPITIDGSSKRILAATISRNWGDVPAVGQPIRWDFEGRCEDVSDDPLRRDRCIATLTVTKKIGDVSFPVAFVYANRSEFLTDVDEQFSAHLGVKFDFSGATK